MRLDDGVLHFTQHGKTYSFPQDFAADWERTNLFSPPGLTRTILTKRVAYWKNTGEQTQTKIEEVRCL